LEPVRPLTDDELGKSTLTPEPEHPPMSLVPTAGAPLARFWAALAPANRARVQEEAQYLYLRQAVAEGGSFVLDDLQRVARSVDARLLIGLRAEGGGPGRESQVLGVRPLHRVVHTADRMLERLRQVALRLVPLEAIFSPEQWALIKSLEHPRLTVDDSGEPRVLLRPGGALPERISLDDATRLLERAADWAELARRVGLEETAVRLRPDRSVDRMSEELALSAVLFGRLDPGLLEPPDRAGFQNLYVSHGELKPEARAALQRVAPGGAGPLLVEALERLAAE